MRRPQWWWRAATDGIYTGVGNNGYTLDIPSFPRRRESIGLQTTESPPARERRNWVVASYPDFRVTQTHESRFPFCRHPGAGRDPEATGPVDSGLRRNYGIQVCRDAQDAKRDIQVAVSPSLVTTAYCAPAALRPCRFATPSHARRWLRSTPANGLTACRMRLHTPSAGLGPLGPAPLRPYARAYAYRGLRAFASLSMARSER